MKKEWLNPELESLDLSTTYEGTCYCEEGAIAEYGARSAATVWHKPGGGDWKPGYGPGHGHKPPHQGGHCPNEPKPQPPEDVENS